jgi:hypothetical protein
LAGRPELVESHVEVTSEQRGAACLTVMADGQDELFGQQAFGFGITLAPSLRFRGGVRDGSRAGR